MPEMTFINAGEGSISHPTQALIDLMTIRQFKSNFDNLKITIVGDLDHSRVVKSFVEGISNFSYRLSNFLRASKHVKIILIQPLEILNQT